MNSHLTAHVIKQLRESTKDSDVMWNRMGRHLLRCVSCAEKFEDQVEKPFVTAVVEPTVQTQLLSGQQGRRNWAKSLCADLGLEKAADTGRLLWAIDQLPSRWQSLIRLRYILGLDLARITVGLGQEPDANGRSRIGRRVRVALNAMRVGLAARAI